MTTEYPIPLTKRQQEVRDLSYKVQNHVLLAHILKFQEGVVSWEEAMTDAACQLATKEQLRQEIMVKNAIGGSYHTHHHVEVCK